MDSARHIIGCHLTLEKSVQYAFEDVAIWMVLATSQDFIELKRRGSEMRVMSWQARSTSPYPEVAGKLPQLVGKRLELQAPSSSCAMPPPPPRPPPPSTPPLPPLLMATPPLPPPSPPLPPPPPPLLCASAANAAFASTACVYPIPM